MGLRASKKLQVKEQLNSAAIALFEARGFHAVTVEEIVAAVNVSRRSFFDGPVGLPRSCPHSS